MVGVKERFAGVDFVAAIVAPAFVPGEMPPLVLPIGRVVALADCALVDGVEGVAVDLCTV